MRKEDKLLLLFGMPRSGTTWLGKIIDSHPDIIYRHEPDSEKKLSLPLMVSDNVDHSSELQNFADQLISYRSAKTCGKAPFFKKSYFNLLTFNLFRGSVLLSKVAKHFSTHFKIVEVINNKQKNNLTILWKSIESVGRIDTIMQTLVGAQMVFIIRSPYGQIASTLRGENKRKFTSQLATDENYESYEQLLKENYAKQHGLTMDYIKSLNAVQRLAVRWVLYNEHALNRLEKYPSRKLIVRYEDVCNHPIEKSKEIFNFASLSWTIQSENFVNSSVSKNEDSYYSLFKNPKTVMHYWKTELSESDIEDIKHIISGSRAGQLYQHV